MIIFRNLFEDKVKTTITPKIFVRCTTGHLKKNLLKGNEYFVKKSPSTYNLEMKHYFRGKNIQIRKEKKSLKKISQIIHYFLFQNKIESSENFPNYFTIIM